MALPACLRDLRAQDDACAVVLSFAETATKNKFESKLIAARLQNLLFRTCRFLRDPCAALLCCWWSAQHASPCLNSFHSQEELCLSLAGKLLFTSSKTSSCFSSIYHSHTQHDRSHAHHFTLSHFTHISTLTHEDSKQHELHNQISINITNNTSSVKKKNNNN